MIPTIIEQMSSTQDKKPRSQFSGMTPSQIRKYHRGLVNPKTFEKYEAFCKDGLKFIRNAPADYKKAYDITLLNYIRIYAGSPALTGNSFFDNDIQSMFDSEKDRFIGQITEEIVISKFSKMVSDFDLPTTTSCRKTELRNSLPITCKVLLERNSGSDGKPIFIVDPCKLVSLLPDEFKPLFEKKQPSAGAVSAPVQKPPFIGFKLVVGNFAGQSTEDRVCSELVMLSKKEMNLVRLFLRRKSSKAMVRDSSRADADAKAGDGDESDDEPDDEPEKKCNAYSIERAAKNVEEMIH